MTAKYVTNTFELTDTYKQILLDVKLARIQIEPSNDNRTRLVFFENAKQPHEFFIQDDTLTIKLTKRKWYHLFNLNVEHSQIKLCVPESMLETISVKSNVGHVDINSITCGKTIDIKLNTGRVLLNDCTAPEIFVKTNTGNVCGRLPSNMVFAIRSNTGKVEIPKAAIGEAIGGRCEIKTNTGNIKFE